MLALVIGGGVSWGLQFFRALALGSELVRLHARGRGLGARGGTGTSGPGLFRSRHFKPSFHSPFVLFPPFGSGGRDEDMRHHSVCAQTGKHKSFMVGTYWII